jgi:hypothetical protein
MEYKASLDTLCKAITAGTFVLLVAVGQSNVRAIIGANGNWTAILIHGSILFLLLGVLIGGYLFSPQSYAVTNTELIIHRPIKDRKIAIADITEIRAIDSAELSGTIRTFGVGGLFGYYGMYYNAKIGSMTWYMTQRKNQVLIRTSKGDKIMISPDDVSLADKVRAGITIPAV